MPADDPNFGRPFIWITACILFICVLIGGGCLVEYVVLPESEVQPWIPLLGITLICLPWAFWLFTFLYQILSRCCGCRISFDVNVGRQGLGGGGGVGSAIARQDTNLKPNDNGLARAFSVASHESQMPLAKSMA
ncbi:hypothetical protein VNO78_02123 [Psophocarpus tetragonolobus]|uniref:Transmembrane protein n=1 Tax=Psophocarpus tetragonolobus TaxID=3891 RepID=A0AAN9XVV3_PSOTE